MLGLLTLFTPAKLALYGALAVATLAAWGVFQYRGAKIDRLERENAAARVEIASTAATANENAAAAARIKADWARAEHARMAAEKERDNVRNRLKDARRVAMSQPASQCGPSPRLVALADQLRQRTTAVDGNARPSGTPIPTRKPSQSAVR